MEEKKKQENALENIFPRHPIIKIVMKVRFLERRIQETVDREDFLREGFFKLFYIFHFFQSQVLIQPSSQPLS